MNEWEAKKEFHLFRILKYARTMPEKFDPSNNDNDDGIVVSSSKCNTAEDGRDVQGPNDLEPLYMWRVLYRIFLYHHY